MAISSFTFSHRVGAAFLAAVVLGLAAGRVGAAGLTVDQMVAQMNADLRSKDPVRVGRVEDKIKDDLDGGRANYEDWRLMDLMLSLGMAKDVDAICLEGIVRRPDSLNLDDMMAARIKALLQEGKKDEALAVSKSFYDAASLAGTATAIRVVTQCLVVDTPPEKRLASRFKRQQIAWAAAATTQPAALAAAATQASGSGGEDLGEPVLATIEVDAAPYDAAIKAIDPLNISDYVRKGNLLLLADRPAEARVAFEQAADIAGNDDQHVEAVEGIGRAIRAQSGCVGPANAYILSLREQK